MKTKRKYANGIPIELGSDDRDARIVAIEYHDGWPHQVVTESTHVNRYSGATWPSGSTYDFDYCGPRHGLWFNDSGSGGRTYAIGRFSDPPSLPGKLWLADGVELVDYQGNPVTPEQAREWGYDMLAEPLLVDGDVNPFTHACEGKTTECTVCGERMPEDYKCQHLLEPDCSGNGFYGCGSIDNEPAEHKEGLFSLFDSMPLADVLSLREKIGTHTYSDWGIPTLIGNLWKEWRWQDKDDNDQPCDHGIGAAWLASLECGKTYDADRQTVAFIDEWRRLAEVQV